MTYNLYYGTNYVSFNSFTSSLSNSFCGAFTYSADDVILGPLDSSIFTLNSLTRTLSIASSDITKNGNIYHVRISGH